MLHMNTNVSNDPFFVVIGPTSPSLAEALWTSRNGIHFTVICRMIWPTTVPQMQSMQSMQYGEGPILGSPLLGWSWLVNTDKKLQKLLMFVSFSTQVVFWRFLEWISLGCPGSDHLRMVMHRQISNEPTRNPERLPKRKPGHQHRKIPADLQCQPRHLQIFHQVKSLERSYLWAQKGNSAEAIFTIGLWISDKDPGPQD